jgi:[ribosomal protein S18]-alanine N-acetyltransferase
MAAVPEAQTLEVHVVPMRRRHLRSVLRIESEVYPRPWSMSLFLSELALRSTRAYFVARVGREVVGYAGLMMTVDDGHVTTIAVDPRWHRHKIGTRLLLAVAREAIDRDATSLTLEVRMANHAAQEMYRRFGFRPVGVRKNYYAETNEDALVMWAHEVDQSEYSELLDALDGQVPGRTIVEAPKRW